MRDSGYMLLLVFPYRKLLPFPMSFWVAKGAWAFITVRSIDNLYATGNLATRSLFWDCLNFLHISIRSKLLFSFQAPLSIYDQWSKDRICYRPDIRPSIKFENQEISVWVHSPILAVAFPIYWINGFWASNYQWWSRYSHETWEPPRRYFAFMCENGTPFVREIFLVHLRLFWELRVLIGFNSYKKLSLSLL